MTVRVLMIRKLPRMMGGLEAELLPQLASLLTELRTLASHQSGYISGETMRNVADPHEYLVISTWRSIEDWEKWFARKKRAELEGKVDDILGFQTQYKVYTYV
ncbi:MAG: antibiotic biosynthesis monooxygenase family protein [bacterium]